MADPKETVIGKEEGREQVRVTGNKVEEYQGKKVSPAKEYSFDYWRYTGVVAAKASEDWPNDSDMLKFVNNRSKVASKAKAYQSETEELRKAYEDSAEFKRKNVIDAVLLTGKTQAEAEAFAASLGL
jgi:putative intracellular protease/amidase